MNPSPLLIHREGHGIATLTLNRAARHNALSGELIDALQQALDALEAEPAVRIIVLTGAGPTFCAGADIDEMRQAGAAGQHENEQDAMRLALLLARLDGLAKPTVARVQGNGFGGALGLIAACDIAIAADSARFALTEVRLGLVPAMISPYVVRAMGARQARRYFLSGERMTAAAARQLGLLHEVTPPDELDACVAATCHELLQGAPIAQAEAKRLIRHVTGRTEMGDDELAAETARWIAQLRASAEGREGLQSFLERRNPAWRED